MKFIFSKLLLLGLSILICPNLLMGQLVFEQKLTLVKSINISFKQLGFQFKDCDGNCEKIFTAIENSLNVKIEDDAVANKVITYYQTLAEKLKDNPDAKRMLKEHVVRIATGGGLTGNEEDELQQIKRENKNNPNYFYFHHDGGLGVEIDRSKSNFPGDVEAFKRGVKQIETEIFYVKDIGDLIKNGKTEYMDLTSFDGTQNAGTKKSYKRIANDELIGLMTEYK